MRQGSGTLARIVQSNWFAAGCSTLPGSGVQGIPKSNRANESIVRGPANDKPIQRPIA